MNHSFNVGIAERFGVNAAIILENIAFWSRKNYANDRRIQDGFAWVFNSVSAWGELFPYLTPDKIKQSLKRLEDAEIISSAIINKAAFDRTKSYAITDAETMKIYSLNNPQSISGKSQMDKREMPNGLVENPKTIPVIDTIIEPIINKGIPSLKEFESHGMSKGLPNVDAFNLKLKYEAWCENGWKDGNDKKIKNWKSKLSNTLPYLVKSSVTGSTVPKSGDSFDVDTAFGTPGA